jgi:hypothetical protein
MTKAPDDPEMDRDVLGIGWALAVAVAFILFVSIFGQCSYSCELRSTPTEDATALPPLGD